MWQQRLWSKARKFDKPAKRPLKISERGIYESVKLEKHVVDEIVSLLFVLNRIPVWIERERIPYCPHCNKKVGKASDVGHPDLHGWIPARKLPPVDNSYCSLQAVAFYIECKRPKGGVESEVQKRFIADAKRDGVLALFARSCQDVKDAFAALGITLFDGQNVHKNDDQAAA